MANFGFSYELLKLMIGLMLDKQEPEKTLKLIAWLASWLSSRDNMLLYTWASS